MANPKSDGTPLAMSVQVSPRSSVRYRPQWFCRYIRSGLRGDCATLCTHCPNSGYLSGRNCARTPLFDGRQVLPPSSVTYMPPVETAMRIRFGSVGSRRTVCRHNPPPPGSQRSRCGWFHSPSDNDHDDPPSRDTNSAAGSTPQYNVSGSISRPGTTCQMFFSATPALSGNLTVASSGFVQVRPKSSLDRNSAPQCMLAGPAQSRLRPMRLS